MPADSATAAWSKLWWTRYAIARSLYSDANTSLIACSTLSMPLTLRKVSCWPANEASGRSSAVADERTATEISGPPDSAIRSEEHTSELQSLMRITYAVSCLKKNTQHSKYLNQNIQTQ